MPYITETLLKINNNYAQGAPNHNLLRGESVKVVESYHNTDFGILLYKVRNECGCYEIVADEELSEFETYHKMNRNANT